MEPDLSNLGGDADQIFSFVKNSEFFNHLSEEDVKLLVSQFETVTLPAGTILMEQGNIGEDLYFIIHGRLSVYKKSGEGEEVVAELGVGEVVGEISILINAPRIASVKTIRDSVLLRLRKKTYDEFSENHPYVSLQLAKRCIARLTFHHREHGLIKTIAIVPTSKSKLTQEFIQNITHGASKSLILDNLAISKKFGVILNNQQLTAWLNEQEFHYDCIYYIADMKDSLWTRLCLRQADAVYYLCDAASKDGLKSAGFQQNTSSRNKCLLLLHENRDRTYSKTDEWIAASKIDDFFHLVPSDFKDIQRAIRIMTGRAIGVVLSGGGARGAAHIGVLRALDELGIPIDIIGGTSIGAIIAALYSLGYDYKQMEEKFNEIIIPGNKLDYTYPYMSISAGENLVKAIKTYSGEHQMIEDLWVRMFAVSTNLTINKEHVHKTGLLWRSLRASASLPGVYPPFQDEKGLLVDGGYLNNLPVSIMKKDFRAGRTIASLVTITSENKEFLSNGESYSGWRLIWNKLNPFNGEPVKAPRIDTIIMKSMTVHDYDRMLIDATKADCCIYLNMKEYGLMDYKDYKKIIGEGYKQSIHQLSKFKN